MFKKPLLILIVIVAAVVAVLFLPKKPVEEQKTSVDDFEIVADNLAIPWEIAFLPDGDILVTERSGMLKRVGGDKKIYNIDGVEHVGEGGLLGMVLHPDFINNYWLYLYFTTKTDGGLTNRVERYRYEGDNLTKRKIILEGVPGAAFHDGGRIAFGPPMSCEAGQADCYLYITTGDAGNPSSAQDINSLAGKILRLSDDGSAPADNPFNSTQGKSPVWSYGHRNPQGLAWDAEGLLWATEHGRSGILSGFDELNLIEKGKNYGWPIIQGDEKQAGMESPIIQSGPDETWAPAGAAYYNGSIFFAGLRGEILYEAKLLERKVLELKKRFVGQFGRLRAVVIGPDNFLYITTSNTDGRGNPRLGDDKIIRVK